MSENKIPLHPFESHSDESDGVVNIRPYRPSKDAKPLVSKEEGQSSRRENLDSPLDADAPQIHISLEENHTEIEKELHAHICEIILTIKEVLTARTVAFYWASTHRKRFIHAVHATDEEKFSADIKLEYSKDIMTEIVLSKSPQLYSEIIVEDEAKFIRYYTEPVGTRSFIGVPVIAKDAVCGVIIADSKEVGHFTREKVQILRRFAKICATGIDTYASKYNYIQSLRFIEPSIQLMRKLQTEQSLSEVIGTFCETLKKAIDFDHLTVAVQNSASELVIRKVLSKSNYVKEGALLDMENSLVGFSLGNGDEGTIDDLSQNAALPRFYEHDTDLPLEGSMLIIPIRHGDFIVGGVTLEVSEKNYFNQDNFSKARFFVQSLSFSLQAILLRDKLKTATPLDEETGALTPNAFTRMMRLEVNRAKRSESKVTLVLLEFDDPEGLERRYGAKGLSSLMKGTMRLLENNIRNYDTIGRLGPLRYGICLYGMSFHNGRFWSEKIREQILNEVFKTEDEYKNILATASIGFSSCEFDKINMQPNEDYAGILYAGAEKALELAVRTGGNVVKVY